MITEFDLTRWRKSAVNIEEKEPVCEGRHAEMGIVQL